VNRGTVSGALIFVAISSSMAAAIWNSSGLSDDGADMLANYGTVGSIVFGGGG
jgi:hypothetical protein